VEVSALEEVEETEADIKEVAADLEVEATAAEEDKAKVSRKTPGAEEEGEEEAEEELTTARPPRSSLKKAEATATTSRPRTCACETGASSATPTTLSSPSNTSTK